MTGIPTVPIMSAVNTPNTSGLCLFKNELHKAIIISQLPTVSPTFVDNPTKIATKGEVPRSDCIVKELPRVTIKIHNT